MFFNVKEVDIYEDDIPTKKETEISSTWFQLKHEYSGRKKSFGCKKIKGKKKIISIGHKFVVFFFYYKEKMPYEIFGIT